MYSKGFFSLDTTQNYRYNNHRKLGGRIVHRSNSRIRGGLECLFLIRLFYVIGVSYYIKYTAGRYTYRYFIKGGLKHGFFK